MFLLCPVYISAYLSQKLWYLVMLSLKSILLRPIHHFCLILQALIHFLFCWHTCSDSTVPLCLWDFLMYWKSRHHEQKPVPQWIQTCSKKLRQDHSSLPFFSVLLSSYISTLFFFVYFFEGFLAKTAFIWEKSDKKVDSERGGRQLAKDIRPGLEPVRSVSRTKASKLGLCFTLFPKVDVFYLQSLHSCQTAVVKQSESQSQAITRGPQGPINLNVFLLLCTSFTFCQIRCQIRSGVSRFLNELLIKQLSFLQSHTQSTTE